MPERIAAWIGTAPSLILHTLAFAASFAFGFLGLAPWDTILLVLTTAVSLEAIYLAIFIQMTMNAQSASLKEVEEDVNEIQKDIDEIQEDVDEIQEDVEVIQDEEARQREQERMLGAMTERLQQLLQDIEKMKSALQQK